MGRSPETIRYTLKRFNMKRPDMAIFPRLHHPLQAETKRQIFQQHCRGESANALAHQFCETRASIDRIINEVLRRTDHGTAAEFHGRRAIRPPPL